MSLELRNSTGHIIPVNNLSEPISLFAATGQTPSDPSIITLSHRGTVYHTLNVDKNDTSLHFEITPQDPNTEIIVYLKRGARPTKEDYDFTLVLPDDPPVNATFPKDRHMFYISNADTNHTTAGTWYLAVFYNGTINPQYLLDSKGIPELFIPKKVNYTLRMYSSGCLFWDEENDRWSGDGCVVSIKLKVFSSCLKFLTSCSKFFTSCSKFLTSCSNFLTSCSKFLTSCSKFSLRVQNFSLRVQSSHFVFKVSHFVFKVSHFVFKVHTSCSKFLTSCSKFPTLCSKFYFVFKISHFVFKVFYFSS